MQGRVERLATAKCKPTPGAFRKNGSIACAWYCCTNAAETHLVARILPSACIPETWIDELADCFESGFQHDLQTIYVDDRLTNQYQGIRDVDLARKLGQLLGVPVDRLAETIASRRGLVSAIQEAVEEA